MNLKTQFTAPLLVDPCGPTALPLSPLPSDPSGGYDERWLQDLLFRHTSLIPVEEVEPVFDGIVPVCRELPTAVGPLDLVFINDQGLLTLGECKLWRNPEARRKVVGQILDYAQEISRWSYEMLDNAIVRAEGRTGSSLWEIARDAFGLREEAVFIDRVSRHLRNGTFLLLIIGDGIRENTENIAAFLQKRAGLSFAFGLVEERLFQIPDSPRILVQPRILAKTVELGRFIVRAETGVVAEDEEEETTMPSESKKGRTLTEAIFIEEVAGNSTLATDLRRLFARLKDEGFNIEPTARGASLKVVPEGMTMNLLTFDRKGNVRNHGCGKTEEGRAYLEKLAHLIPDATSRIGTDEGWSSTVLHKDGKPLHAEEIVAIETQWINLLKDVRDKLNKADAIDDQLCANTND